MLSTSCPRRSPSSNVCCTSRFGIKATAHNMPIWPKIRCVAPKISFFVIISLFSIISMSEFTDNTSSFLSHNISRTSNLWLRTTFQPYLGSNTDKFVGCWLGFQYMQMRLCWGEIWYAIPEETDLNKQWTPNTTRRYLQIFNALLWSILRKFLSRRRTLSNVSKDSNLLSQNRAWLEEIFSIKLGPFSRHWLTFGSLYTNRRRQA